MSLRTHDMDWLRTRLLRAERAGRVWTWLRPRPKRLRPTLDLASVRHARGETLPPPELRGMRKIALPAR